MTNCLEIIVVDPTRAGQNRVNDVEMSLDIPEQDVVRLYKDVQALNILTNTFNQEAAIKFSLPWSLVNDAASIDYYTPNVLDRKRKFLTVRVLIDSHPARLTRLYVTNKSNERQQWDYELLPPEDDFLLLASEKKLCTIDYGYTAIDDVLITASWEIEAYGGNYNPADNDCAIMTPADYGGWVDTTPPPQTLVPQNYKTVSNEDIRPWISLPYILKQGACEIGWTIAGAIFDSEWFRRLWVYILKKDYYLHASINNAGVVVGNRYETQVITGFQANLYGPKFKDLSLGAAHVLSLGGGEYQCGVINPVQVRSWYKFVFRANVTNNGTAPSILTFAVGEIDPANNALFTGEVLSEAVYFTVAVDETKFVSLEIPIELEGSQRAAIFMYNIGEGAQQDYTVEIGMFFRADPDNKAYTTGDTIQINKSVRCDKTYLDYLKGVVALIDGRLDFDYTTKTAYLYSNRSAVVHGETLPGFVMDGVTIDITDKVIQSSINATPVRRKLKRRTLIEFAKSNDAWITQQNLSENSPAHSRMIENGVDLPEGIDKRTNPFFEPTLEGRDLRLKTDAGGRASPPWLPRLWDNSDGNRSFDIGPRVAFMFGKVKQVNPSPTSDADEYTSFYYNGASGVAYPTGNLVQLFGYLTQRRTWELDPTPAMDGSVVYGTLPNDLFVCFLLGITQDNQNGTDVTLLMFMNMAEYSSYNFRPNYYFDDNGRPMKAIMQSISDFAGCASYSTPARFFVSPANTLCCDRPCGCRFKNCDFYMDFGIMLKQTTLDVMRVSKFLIDGVELLDAPVEFGTINVETFGTRPYVTNLVDTLNAIAAPYFFFEYSARVSVGKGLRFFRAKWPACQSFEIEITYDGDPVYRYTDISQETQWFGGGWEPLGYGAEEYSEPENCILSIEY